MAAKVNVATVVVLDNPSNFTDDIRLEITFECFEDLEEDLDWKVTYVGSSKSDEFDQVLESIAVGPVPEGKHKFVLDAPPPDLAKIPSADLLGVTVLLLSCEYRGQEFINIGYYVATEYDEQEMNDEPPEVVQVDKLRRRVTEEPRVTHRSIKWTSDALSIEGLTLESSSVPTAEGEEEGNSCDIVTNEEAMATTETSTAAEDAPFADVTNSGKDNTEEEKTVEGETMEETPVVIQG